MNPFSILMFIFSAAILLYAALLAMTQDFKLVPRSVSVKPTDPKAYARNFAKVMALVALGPANGAYYALFNMRLGVFMLFYGFAVCMWAGVWVFQNQP